MGSSHYLGKPYTKYLKRKECFFYMQTLILTAESLSIYLHFHSNFFQFISCKFFHWPSSHENHLLSYLKILRTLGGAYTKCC